MKNLATEGVGQDKRRQRSGPPKCLLCRLATMGGRIVGLSVMYHVC